MKIRFSILAALLVSFSINTAFAQQLQLVKVIDTVLSVKTTNGTGVNLGIDVTKSPLVSNVLEVPKGKIWVINSAQVNSMTINFWTTNNFGSSQRATSRLKLDDGGDVFYHNSLVAGKLTLTAGTKINLDISIPTDRNNRYKWHMHYGDYPSTYVWYQYFFSITEYEIVP